MLMQSHFLNLILLYVVWASKLACAYLCVLLWSYRWLVHDLWLTVLTFGIAHLN